MEKFFRILMTCIIVLFAATLLYGWFATDKIKAQPMDHDSTQTLSDKDSAFSPPAEMILLAKEADSLVSDLVRITARLRYLKVRLDSMSQLIRDSLMDRVSYSIAMSDSVWRDTTDVDSCEEVINNVDWDTQYVHITHPPLDSLISDCEHQTNLDSLERWADSWDSSGKANIRTLNLIELKKHEGHLYSYSQSQNAVFCSDGYDCPICYECKVCGHFDLYVYNPLRRYSIQCGDQIYQIPIR